MTKNKIIINRTIKNSWKLLKTLLKLLKMLISQMNCFECLSLLEKDLDAIVHELEEETEETDLETAKLSNGEKSAWFNLKVTPIL